jgi:hypothetical protein
LETVIHIDPFNGERALSGSLAQIFRVTDDPIRVYYCGSADQKIITVIRIADTPLRTTKEFLAKWKGHNDDAILANLVRMLPNTPPSAISKFN